MQVINHTCIALFAASEERSESRLSALSPNHKNDFEKGVFLS